ncbi:hypothetical protein QJS66_02345 [Kocuria rhizophila]|nr:hypothetical protein QJS66_02345 [Kocuria rhizophila]
MNQRLAGTWTWTRAPGARPHRVRRPGYLEISPRPGRGRRCEGERARPSEPRAARRRTSPAGPPGSRSPCHRARGACRPHRGAAATARETPPSGGQPPAASGWRRDGHARTPPSRATHHRGHRCTPGRDRDQAARLMPWLRVRARRHRPDHQQRGARAPSARTTRPSSRCSGSSRCARRSERGASPTTSSRGPPRPMPPVDEERADRLLEQATFAGYLEPRRRGDVRGRERALRRRGEPGVHPHAHQEEVVGSGARQATTPTPLSRSQCAYSRTGTPAEYCGPVVRFQGPHGPSWLAPTITGARPRRQTRTIWW